MRSTAVVLVLAALALGGPFAAASTMTTFTEAYATHPASPTGVALCTGNTNPVGAAFSNGACFALHGESRAVIQVHDASHKPVRAWWTSGNEEGPFCGSVTLDAIPEGAADVEISFAAFGSSSCPGVATAGTVTMVT